MKANDEKMYWFSNRDWYRINENTHKFELTEKATPLAHASFEKWKRPSFNVTRLFKTIKYHIL